MSCPLEVKTLYITSLNRDTTKYPHGNSYTLYLTTPIKDIKTVELLYASIPNSIHNITDGLDVITFPSATGAPPTITANIAPGFYNSSTIVAAINNARPSTAYDIVLSYLPAEGKFLFLADGDFNINLSSQLASLLGFDSGINEAIEAATTPFLNDAVYTLKWYIKSKDIVEMNPIDGIFLDIQELRSMYNECTPTGYPVSSLNNSNAAVLNQLSDGRFSTANRSFGMIPIDVSSGGMKRFKQETDYNLYIDYTYPIQKIDRLTVTWVDRNGNPVNFNGADINTFILRFHTLRKNLC